MNNYLQIGSIVVITTLLSVSVQYVDLKFDAYAQSSPSDSFALQPDNDQPRGITFYDNKFWVTDATKNAVFVYSSDGTPDGKSWFKLHDENQSPYGIVYHDNKFWVVDNNSFMVFAYETDGTPDDTSSFSLPSTDSYSGITFHDGKFWVIGLGTGKIYSCSIESMGECIIDTNSEINLTPQNNLGSGIIFYSGKFWVSDIIDEQLFAYDIDGTYDGESSFSFSQSSGLSFGMALYDEKLWLVSNKYDVVNSFDLFSTSDLPASYNLDPGNVSPGGMTFHDGRFWMTDINEDRIYVYKFEEGSTRIVHSIEDEFLLDSIHTNPIGIDYANDRFWIVETAEDKIYSYGVDGTIYLDSTISLAQQNKSPIALAINNENLWVVDRNNDAIFVYNFDGTHDEESGFPLRTENSSPSGITFYDEKLWILDRTAGKIFVYNLDGTIPDELPEFALHFENTQGFTIAYHDDKFWIADNVKREVFAYDTSGERISGLGFLLDNGNTNPTGMVFADDRFWLVEHDDRRIYDYTVNWKHDSFAEFILHEMNKFPVGVTFDGTNLWVVDIDVGMVFSYTFDGEFAGEPFQLHETNRFPSGITFDGTKLWVTDEHVDKLFAYDLNGEFDTVATFEILAGTDEPSGIIFVDDKFWVIDVGRNSVIAYDTDGKQDSSFDFILHDENSVPVGIAFADGTFWVADKNGAVYPYPMELNIGLLSSVTNLEFLEQGREIKLAAGLAIMDFNESLRSMDSIWRMNADFVDTNLDAEQTSKDIMELNSNGIDVIVGVPTNASVDMVKEYVNDNDMVLVSCCSSASHLAVEDNIFRMVPSDSGQAPILARHILNAEKSDIIIIYRDDAWGVGLKDVLDSSFEELGGTILYDIMYDSEDAAHADFDGIASMTSSMLSEHENPTSVGVVFLGWSETATMMEVAGDYPNLSNVTWFGSSDNAGNSADVSAVKSAILEEPAVSFAMNTSFSVVQFIPESNDMTEKVKTHVMRETGREPAVYAYSTYDAVWVAGLAMLEADSNDGSNILSQIHTVASKRIGAMGPNALTSTGDLALSNYTVNIVKDGMWKDLGPVNTAKITGTIFSDVNKNGIMDAGEPGIENYEMVAINLTNPSDIMKTTTNSDGMYEFAVEISDVMLVQTGYFPPNTTVSDVNTSWFKYVTLQAGFAETFDIGFIPIPPEEYVTLNFIMYLDENQNGKMDAGELPVSGLDDFYVFTYTIGPVAYPVPDEMGRATVDDLVPSDFAVFAHVGLLADAGYSWITTSYTLHGDDIMEYILTAPVIGAPEPGSEYTMMVGLSQLK